MRSPTHLNDLPVFEHVAVLGHGLGRSLQRFGALKREEHCLKDDWGETRK